ncbi:MAG: phosphonoacetaldehyde reductase [Deltaproteobacteria bacterium]|nr:phosphonoacetaldehyde reductase [Deltaproteobacteria bacterium]
MDSWRFYNPVDVRFGEGCIQHLPEMIAHSRMLLMTTAGATQRGLTRTIQRLAGTSLAGVFDTIDPNPTFSMLRTVFDACRVFDYDLIVAVGGGSVIDTAKEVAAMAAAPDPGWLEQHLQQGAGFPELFKPKPVIAIPTTAGTGSEVTMWATVWDMDAKKKYSIAHEALFPRHALLDPELTLTLPLQQSLYAALDALSHAMEAVWNKNHNPVSDTLALGAVALLNQYLPLLAHDGQNLNLRSNLMRASLMAGLAFSNTKTALAHSLSYPLSIYFGLPHGLACSLPLPHVLRFNGEKAYERIKLLAAPLASEPDAESMAACIEVLFDRIDISFRLRDYAVDKSRMAAVAQAAITPERAGNNIAAIDQTDVARLVEALY